MQISLIQGQYSAADAATLIEQMIQIEISFHEKKISHHSTEEEIKFRETKIKKLQEKLASFKRSVYDTDLHFNLVANCIYDPL